MMMGDPADDRFKKVGHKNRPKPDCPDDCTIGTESANGRTNNNNNKKRTSKDSNEVKSDHDQKQDEEDANLANVDDAIQILLDHHIADNRKVLRESWVNLDKIADYCEANYFQLDDKTAGLDETKNYTTRALASVANQIHSFASNFSTLLDLQMNGMNEVETRLNGMISKTRFHEEKSARREIGLLTKPKLLTVQPKIVKPLYPERSKRQATYTREPIDYSILDRIGQAHLIYEKSSKNQQLYGGNRWMPGQVKSATLRPSKSSNLSMMMNNSTNNYLHHHSSALIPNHADSEPNHQIPGSQPSNPSSVGAVAGTGSSSHYRTPAPTARPPTPPLSGTMRFSSLSRTSKDYRSLHGGLIPPPIVAPPQLPTNYGTTLSGTIGRSSNLNSTNPGTAPAATETTQSSVATANVSSAPIVSKAQVSNHQHEHYQSSANGATNSTQSHHHPHFHHHSTNPFVQPQVSSNTSNVNNLGGAEVNRQANVSSAVTSSAPSARSNQSAAPTVLAINNKPVIEQTNSSTPTNANWIPQSYLEKVVAIYDYSADKDDELSFQENSVIYVVRKNEDGWWEGVLNGITGLFPGNYVEPCIV